MSDEQALEQSGRHLDYLSIAFWIYAGFNLIGCCCTQVFTLPIGAGLLFDGHDEEAVAGGIMLASGVIVCLIILLYAGAMALNASLLSRRSGYTGVICLSVLAALNLPFGTILGILTLIVMTRDSTRELFGQTTQR